MRIISDIWLLESYALYAGYFGRVFQKTILNGNPPAQYVIIPVNHFAAIYKSKIKMGSFKKKRRRKSSNNIVGHDTPTWVLIPKSVFATINPIRDCSGACWSLHISFKNPFGKNLAYVWQPLLLICMQIQICMSDAKLYIIFSLE